MQELIFEILLRLPKALAALVVGLIVYWVVVGLIGASASAELALLCWLSGAAFILLVQEGPI